MYNDSDKITKEILAPLMAAPRQSLDDMKSNVLTQINVMANDFTFVGAAQTESGPESAKYVLAEREQVLKTDASGHIKDGEGGTFEKADEIRKLIGKVLGIQLGSNFDWRERETYAVTVGEFRKALQDSLEVLGDTDRAQFHRETVNQGLAILGPAQSVAKPTGFDKSEGGGDDFIGRIQTGRTRTGGIEGV